MGHEYIIQLQRLVFTGHIEPKDNGVWWLYSILDGDGETIHTANKAVKGATCCFNLAKRYLKSEGMKI